MGLKETFQNKTKEISESGSWDKVKTGYKKVETGVWKGLEPVGRWSNKQAGKLGMESFWPTEMNLECDKAARILKTFTDKGATVEIPSSSTPTSPTSSTAPTTNDEDGAIIPPDLSQTGKKPSDPHKHDSKKTQKVIKKISPKVLSEAKGIAIFTMFRTGLGLSGAGGSGVVLKRLPDGSWSGPSGILLHTIGYGFLVGLDIYDVVLVLRTEKAVQAFEKPKISLGGELSVTAGPVGNGVMLDSGIEASPCWSYVKSKGFYAGVQLDGNIILQRGDENARFYNEKADVSEILNGRFNSNNNDSLPKGALPLLQTLYASEGRPGVLGLDLVPKNDQVVAPSDLYNNDSTQGQGHVENQPQAQGQSSQYKQDPQYADQPQHVGESGQYQAPSYPPDDVEQGSSTDPNQPLPAYQDQSSVSQSPFADPQNATPQNSAAYPPEKTGH